MERPTALAVDSSIAVKWFVPEHYSQEAVKIRNVHTKGEISLFAPDLLTFELANALRYRSNTTNHDLVASIESLFNLDLTLIGPTGKSTSRAAHLARILNLTVYDASYHELAETLDCQLVTSDHPFFDKVQEGKLDNSRRITLLKDFFLRTRETGKKSSNLELQS